jgi:hypothetical protein
MSDPGHPYRPHDVQGPLPAHAVMPEPPGPWLYSFGGAFYRARRAGWPNFEWHGRIYHTRQADDPPASGGDHG